MFNIVFICYGNICRSPMAEMIFKDIMYKNSKRYLFNIESRSTSMEELGNPIYPPAIESLKMHGVTIEKHFATQFKKDDYDKFDYIIVMEERNRRDVLSIIGEDKLNKIHLMKEHSESKNDILDPWYTGDFESAFKDIQEGCTDWFNYLVNKEADNEV